SLVFSLHESATTVVDTLSLHDALPIYRVVVCPTVACGNCSYCRAGYYAQCDNANPQGPRAGTAFLGGPESSGAIHGLQAEKARIPHANIGLIKLPDTVSDEQ